MVNPCTSAVISVAGTYDDLWPSEAWNAGEFTLTVPMDDVSYVTDPSGVNCGDYTWLWAINKTPPEGASATFVNNVLTLNFGHVASTLDSDWILTPIVKLADYPTRSNTLAGHTISLNDPCSSDDIVTITLGSTNFDAWADDVSVY